MPTGRILELTFGGFQVFAEPVSFPLGPITLVFGPNSAGKSAIADGLQMLSSFAALFDVGASETQSEVMLRAASHLERHWRLEPGTLPVQFPAVHLGVRTCLVRSAWADAAIATTFFTASCARRATIASCNR